MGRTVREKTDEYAVRGGHAFRKFQMACIRTGNYSILEREMASPKFRETMKQLFSDGFSDAFYSLIFVWAQAWEAAVSAGLPEREADRIYLSYFQRAKGCRSVEHLLKCHTEILIRFAESVGKYRTNIAVSALIRKVSGYVDEHIYEVLRVQEIAENMMVNASYLSHSFKEEMGMSLTSYIQMKKMDAAKLLLLQSESSVTDVMEQLGYISQSHFTTAFRRYTGMTPGQYKLWAQKDPSERTALSGRTLSTEEDWYLQIEEFGNREGLELQSYTLACVRRGKTAPLLEYFESAAYLEKLQSLLEKNLEKTIEIFVYLWPQAAHVAAESGLPLKDSVGIMSEYLSRLYNCKTVLEVLDLNKNYFLNLADSVAKL